MFGPLAPELLVCDLKIGFLVKNYTFSPQEMPRIPELELIGGLGPFERVVNGFKRVKVVMILQVLTF